MHYLKINKNLLIIFLHFRNLYKTLNAQKKIKENQLKKIFFSNM